MKARRDEWPGERQRRGSSGKTRSKGGERCTVRGVSCRPVLQEGDKLSRTSAVCRCRRQPHAGARAVPSPCSLPFLFPFKGSVHVRCSGVQTADDARAHTHMHASGRDRDRFSFSSRSRSNLSCAAVKIVDVVGLPCAAAALCCVARVLPCLRRLRQLSLRDPPASSRSSHLPCVAWEGSSILSLGNGSSCMLADLVKAAYVRVSRCAELFLWQSRPARYEE
jgi:hypothetical protein